MSSFAQLTTFRETAEPPAHAGTVGDLPIAVAERPGRSVHGLYVHIPFCFHKCHYCDFYSFVDTRGQQPAFVRRLREEIRAAREYLDRPMQTVFVGGGTPTLLAPELWRELLEGLTGDISLEPGCEFTVEANPETVDRALLEVLLAGGVNRISIGAQTFHAGHLVTLERHHDPAAVGRSVRLVREAGISNVNIDLIFAIPGQTLDHWQADLRAALDLEPAHISCYGLTYEPNTPLTRKLRAGLITRADQELEAAMYETAMEMLAAEGLEHYEVSNWARPQRQCRHNLLYWRNDSWWPLGPSASGHVAGTRWKNVPHLGAYLDRGPLPPITDVERLDEDGRIGETLMLGLRLTAGIADDRLGDLLSRGTRAPQRRAAVERHTDSGLLGRTAGRLHLTHRGLLLADTVLADLL